MHRRPNDSAVVLYEGRLHRVQLVITRETFDGGDLVAFMRYGASETGINSAAVRQNGARTTLGMIAALFEPVSCSRY